MAMSFFQNRYLLWTSVVVLLVSGFSALSGIPRLEDPRMTNRNPIMVAPFPGASAERVESLITEKMEKVLQEIPEIKKIESTSRVGVATISMELVDAIGPGDNERIFSKIRDKMSDVELPQGALPPTLDDQRGAVAFTLIMAFTWNFDSEPRLGILKRHSEEFADRIRSIPGTEIVRLYGEPIEEITVNINPAELAALQLTANDVSQSIAGADSKQPAGQLRGNRSDISLEVTGALDSISRVQSIPLRDSDEGAVVRIADVATVKRNWQNPPREIALADQVRSVFIAARMKGGYRVDDWAKKANEVVDEYRSQMGTGIELKTIFDQSTYTEERLSSLAANLIAGAFVIMAVIFMFMGWRSSLLVGSALPLVTGLTLFIILINGGSLHQMSIFGMIIALGLLIDNAIVIVDEIRKNREKGLSREEAVETTVDHLFGPLIASTLTTVFAFAPIVLLPGNIGDFVGPIGVSVVIAIICSFLVAISVIAALAGRYDSDPPKGKVRFWNNGFRSKKLGNLYVSTLKLALKFPVLAVAIAISPAIMGFVLSSQLGNQFFPRVDRNMFRAQIWLPAQSSLDNTRNVVQNVEKQIRESKDISNVHWLIGGSAPTVYYNLVMDQDQSAHYAQAIIVTETKESVKGLIRKLQPILDQEFPEAQIVVDQFGQGPPVDAPVQFRVYGPNVTVLQNIGEEIRLEMQKHPEMLHTQATMPRGKPKLWVNTDENAARLAGLTLSDVAMQLQTNLEGQVGGTILEGIEEMPVRVRFSEKMRSDLADISATTLVSKTTEQWIPLRALGDIELRPELGGISRRDGIRANTLKGYVTNNALPIEVSSQILAAIDAKGYKLPTGYRIEIGGNAEEEAGAVGQLKTYMPVLITLTIATLVLAFRSIMLSIVLGSVAILSVGLAFFSTWVMGYPLSFNTILGTLGLIGVALNDNIVVLAAIRANPLAKMGDINAIAEEVAASTRHVLSTTLTTTGGFLPLIIAGGDFWPPLAVVIAGGVLGASLIALLYIPAIYVIITSVQNRIFGQPKPVTVNE